VIPKEGMKMDIFFRKLTGCIMMNIVLDLVSLENQGCMNAAVFQDCLEYLPFDHTYPHNITA